MKTVIYLHDFFMIIKKFNYEENHFNLQIRAFGFNIDFFVDHQCTISLSFATHCKTYIFIQRNSCTYCNLPVCTRKITYLNENCDTSKRFVC